MRAEEIGALAMMETLTRIWLPAGTPREDILAGFDGAEHRRWMDEFIGDKGSLHSSEHIKNIKNDRSSYFQFYATISSQTQFEYHERHGTWRLFSTETFPSDDEEPGFKFYGYMGCISLDDEYGLFVASRGNRPETPTRMLNDLPSPLSGSPSFGVAVGCAAATLRPLPTRKRSGCRALRMRNSKRGI